MNEKEVEMMFRIKRAIAKSQQRASILEIAGARQEAQAAANLATYYLEWGGTFSGSVTIFENDKNVTLEMFRRCEEYQTTEAYKRELTRRQFGQFKDSITGQFNMTINKLQEVFPEQPKELLAVVALEHVAKDLDIWSKDHKNKFKSVLK